MYFAVAALLRRCIAHPLGMLPNVTATEPESSATLSARLAALKSRQCPDDDPRVVACREALAYRRVQKAIEAEAGQLSPAAVADLITQLQEAGARP